MLYLPYGEIWIDEGSDPFKLGYKFTGKEMDEETGYTYFGGRYYEPKTSRWISTDPALAEYLPRADQVYFPEEVFDAKKLKGAGGVFNSKNLNVYHYAGLNPLKLIDPDGRAIKSQALNLRKGRFNIDVNGAKIAVQITFIKASGERPKISERTNERTGEVSERGLQIPQGSVVKIGVTVDGEDIGNFSFEGKTDSRGNHDFKSFKELGKLFLEIKKSGTHKPPSALDRIQRGSKEKRNKKEKKLDKAIDKLELNEKMDDFKFRDIMDQETPLHEGISELRKSKESIYYLNLIAKK